MAKKQAEVTTLEGTATIENVGYTNYNLTALVCKGETAEVYGANFYVIIREGEYEQYNPEVAKTLIGKTVKFTFTEVDDIRRPKDAVFVSIQ